MQDIENSFEVERIVTDTFVEQVHYYETIESTNDVALEHCRRDDLRAPLLVVASQQTSGRGRGSNQWWSAAGSLTFSLALRPADLGLTKNLWPRASLTSGFSVCLALSELLASKEVLLKWPNDVHLRRRKISGVLVEIGPHASETVVIGIGVNVNNSFHSAPKELQSIATSMVDVMGEPFDLTRVLIAVLRHLEQQFSRLATDDVELAADWQRQCALSGLTVQVDTPTQSTTGICQGIDEEGALVLLTEGGPTRLFAGVVARIW